MGGPIEGIKRSTAVLTAQGHDVDIVSLDGPNEPWLRDLPFTLHALGPGTGSFGYSAEFTRWMKEHGPTYDAVLVHGVWQYSSFGVWRALAGSTTPYFVFPHGMLDPWFNRTYPLKHLKKLLYWHWGEYRVLRDAAAVLFTSEAERLAARKSFSRYRCNEEVVNYGTAAPQGELSAARAAFLARYPELEGKRVFLFLSRLHEKKGCELLINALAALPRAQRDAERLHLVMAGPCADEVYLQRLKERARSASETSGAQITFTGMLSGNYKWGAFAAADAFVLPSHQENFGIAVAEALACGTPVLVSTEVNIWREIVDAGAGFADEDDEPGTLRLLTKWLSLDRATADTMRVAARKAFAERFEITRAVQSLLETLRRYV